ETVDCYAPGFKASVVGRQALSPLDLEQVFGLTAGDIFHGALSLDQLFSARPMLGYADYRGPLKGLYHCGSGAHPGGRVTGAPGHNAAGAITADRRSWRSAPRPPRHAQAECVANRRSWQAWNRLGRRIVAISTTFDLSGVNHETRDCRAASGRTRAGEQRR